MAELPMRVGKRLVTLRKDLSRADLLAIVRDECSETIRAADVLEDDRERTLIRMGVALVWYNLVERVCVEAK